MLQVSRNGQQYGIVPGLTVRSPDMDGDGAVSLDDVVIFSSAFNTMLGDLGYTACADLQPSGTIDLNDFARFTQHYNHGCSSQKSPHSRDMAILDMVQLDQHDLDMSQCRLSLLTPLEIKTIAFEIPIGAEKLVSGWQRIMSAKSVICAERGDGENKILLVLVTDLDQSSGKNIEVVDLTLNVGMEILPTELFAEISSAALTDLGDILQYDATVSGIEPLHNATSVWRAYPNPFNPAITIEYYVAHPSRVQILIYDVAGRLVKTLVDELQKASEYVRSVQWDGRNVQGEKMASGMYFWRLKTNDCITSGRIVLVK